MKAEPASFEKIRAALAVPGSTSSDFDLNGDQNRAPVGTLRPAGVLVPLIERDGEINVILTNVI